MAEGTMTWNADPTDSRYVFVNGRRLAIVAGGDGEGDDSGGDDSGGDDDSGGSSGGTGSDQGRQSGSQDAGGGGDDSGGGDGDDTGGDSGEDAVTSEERKELNRLRRERAAEAKKARDAEKARKREAGQHQELAQEAERERDEANARADEAEAEREAIIRGLRVTAVAQRYNMHDPSMAVQLLTEDETEDDASAESAIKKLAKSKPFLFGDPPRTGGPGGDGGGESQTPEQQYHGTLRDMLTSGRAGS